MLFGSHFHFLVEGCHISTRRFEAIATHEHKTDRFHCFLLLPLDMEPEDGAKAQEGSGEGSGGLEYL